jgi:excisionase family DNA binding protein
MLLTVRQVAAKLNVSLRCVYQLIEARAIPCHRIGIGRGTIRVQEGDVDAYLIASRSPDKSAPTPPPVSRPGGAFRHLNAERLRAAWRQQGVDVDSTDAGSAPSS